MKENSVRNLLPKPLVDMMGMITVLGFYFVIVLATTGVAHYLGRRLPASQQKKYLDMGLIGGLGISALLWVKYGRDISVKGEGYMR